MTIPVVICVECSSAKRENFNHSLKFYGCVCVMIDDRAMMMMMMMMRQCSTQICVMCVCV